MNKFVSAVATIEIPVSNLEKSLAFYTEVLAVDIHFKGDKNAMLTFGVKGVPTLFLVETDNVEKLSFANSSTGVEHSIIDFYTPDLKGFYDFLVEKNVEVGSLNLREGSDLGGFGFRDPDGNLLSACNIVHPGQ
ncbi:VOC family protein [Mangrovibacillus cuniculi]|uniref:VOC family protein n=1 Tax=Mangrovibacillus cuniculi TaxID=2593652 RepID=A0A7S8HG76_9BACI|nr:VOC family protein [Mangrovibacillus cuniculi]QPC47603.1 VOC family protein [Mangrovibacillus cuniculi]